MLILRHPGRLRWLDTGSGVNKKMSCTTDKPSVEPADAHWWRISAGALQNERDKTGFKHGKGQIGPCSIWLLLSSVELVENVSLWNDVEGLVEICDVGEHR